MADWYDREGKPLDMASANGKLGNPDYKRVADDTVGEWWVSTVWLGLNHRFGPGRPLIFETMVFPANEFPGGDQYQDRYETEEEARRGHAHVVDALKRGEHPASVPPGGYDQEASK